jgi:hypothetical protein
MTQDLQGIKESEGNTLINEALANVGFTSTNVMASMGT